MAISLGVDTGGTYTDAVLLRDETEVLASAKALTTRQDLAIGIGNAIRAVLADSAVAPSQITLASLSTTLATNALIEGQGEPVGLILVGFTEKDLARHGLAEALAGDPVLYLQGGHDHAGNEAAALDISDLQDWLTADGASVSGFAVAAKFATRNTAHEKRISQVLKDQTAKPVSSSHQLSARLNGPKRALTALLNARLIGMIDRLISRAQTCLAEAGIDAPLMVVRGDGALISAEFARERPIETILSGPAASIVGASWMTGIDHAMVSDIGGTTTDIAVLRKGRPAIDPMGATVGGFRTMVEAVAMRTTGLGGDSEVHFLAQGLSGGVRLGPRRVLPVSLVATYDADLVHGVLDKQLRAETVPEHLGKFVLTIKGMPTAGLPSAERALLERIGDGLQILSEVLKTRREFSLLRRLVDRGLVQVSGVTPSDASHVLGKNSNWDGAAAAKALELFRRQITGAGNRLAASAADMAHLIIDQLTHQTAVALLEAAFAEEPEFAEFPPLELANHVLMQRGLDSHRGLLKLQTGLNLPIVGLGASAPTYYPDVGKRLDCETILPEHAGVANAIGAVVGRVTIRRSATLTSPSAGLFRLHLDSGPADFADADAALHHLESTLTAAAQQAAIAAGAEDVQTHAIRDMRTAEVEGSEVLVEATLTIEASGRPRIADQV